MQWFVLCLGEGLWKLWLSWGVLMVVNGDHEIGPDSGFEGIL